MSSDFKHVSKAVEDLSDRITTEFPGLPNTRWIALRLLEGDQKIIDALRSGELGSLKPAEAVGE
jgi:ferrous iron transport protein B